MSPVNGLSHAGHASDAGCDRSRVPSRGGNEGRTGERALRSLLAIALVGLPVALRLEREDRWVVVRDIIHTFSPAALVFAGITVAVGTFMAWTHLGSVQAVWTTDYGRVLLAKLTLLAATAATGAYNWLRVRPTLGDDTSTRRLRRSSAVELGIAGLVLAVTAVLVATPPPVNTDSTVMEVISRD